MEENNNLEKKVENIIISKSKMVYGIVLVMLPIVGFFFKIQLDVALIKQNHEAHMQAALEKIAELEKQESELLVKLDKDHEAIIQLMTVHKKELGQ